MPFFVHLLKEPQYIGMPLPGDPRPKVRNLVAGQDYPQTYRELVFHRLLEQAVAIEPVTVADVTHGYNWDKHNM